MRIWSNLIFRTVQGTRSLYMVESLVLMDNNHPHACLHERRKRNTNSFGFTTLMTVNPSQATRDSCLLVFNREKGRSHFCPSRWGSECGSNSKGESPLAMRFIQTNALSCISTVPPSFEHRTITAGFQRHRAGKKHGCTSESTHLHSERHRKLEYFTLKPGQN